MRSAGRGKEIHFRAEMGDEGETRMRMRSRGVDGKNRQQAVVAVCCL